MKEIVFSIEGENLRKVESFVRQHEECCIDKISESGALVSYTFIPMELGMIISVKCSCGEKLELIEI